MSHAMDFLHAQLSESPPMGPHWPDEHARWTELIFCTLFQIRPLDAGATRHAVDVARDLQLLEPSLLRDLVSNPDERIALALILSRAGWQEAEVDRGLTLLTAVAKALDAYSGKPQRLLRDASISFRDAVVSKFEQAGRLDPTFKAAVGHWLQNTCNLPLSIDDEAVSKFAAASGLTLEQLIEASDNLDLNVGALDDLIRREHVYDSSEAR